MPPKRNPLNLNPLQLRTLTLLQALAREPGHPALFPVRADREHLLGHGLDDPWPVVADDRQHQ